MDSTLSRRRNRSDYDSPWKELLERWHRPFLEFFFPRAAADVDWSRGHEFLAACRT